MIVIHCRFAGNVIIPLVNDPVDDRLHFQRKYFSKTVSLACADRFVFPQSRYRGQRRSLEALLLLEQRSIV